MQRQSLQASLPAGRDGQRRVERFIGGIVLGESDEAFADDEEQANLRVRLIGKLVAYPGAGLPQQSHRGQRFGRVGIGEQRRDELLHLFRAFLFGAGELCLARGIQRGANEHDGHRGTGRHRELVARDELPRAVAAAVALRQHRPGTQVALDVVEQRVHRGITIRGFLLERLEHHGVEIAAQRGAATRIGHDAGQGRVGLQDGVFQRAA